MAKEDQRVRVSPSGAEGRFTYELDDAEMLDAMAVDTHNTTRLSEIVREHGWPGCALVGHRGAHHAWLIAQHADRHLDFQREALRLLTDAVAAGDASPRNLAYLTDRVRANEGQEQLYGTQMHVKEGRPVPWPIKDPQQVDIRRAGMGLEPLVDYIARF